MPPRSGLSSAANWRLPSSLRSQDRLDVNNGLILSALIDRLFDRGLITFDDLGAMIISPCLSFQDRKTCQLDRPVEILLLKESLRYMEYHRLFVFKA